MITLSCGPAKICSSVADGKGIGLLVHNFIDDDHDVHNVKLVMSKCTCVIIINSCYTKYIKLNLPT